MIASGIALAFNRKLLAGTEQNEPGNEGGVHALKFSAAGHDVSKPEVSAMIDLPHHMDHWFSESSPRAEPMIVTCLVPKHVAKESAASIPSPVCSPSVLSSQQLQIWRAMAKAKEPAPSIRGLTAVHSMPQMVPGKGSQENAKSQGGKHLDDGGELGSGNGMKWQHPTESSLAPNSPSPLPRKVVSRCFSEEDWSVSSGGTELTEASSTASEQLFDMGKSGECSCHTMSSLSSLASSIQSCPPSTMSKADTGLDSVAYDQRMTDRSSNGAAHPTAPNPTVDTQREAYEATVASLRSELAALQRDQERTNIALQAKTNECESLLQVVRELTESRCKLVNARVGLMELAADLEQENTRLSRITDLSRTISRENLDKANAAYCYAEKAKDEAYKQRQVAAALRCANSQLEQEKQALLKRLESLSALQAANSSENTGPSACMLAFTASWALKATY
eukprot:jgi/Botrbrau1/10368/Bobra.146_2s0007.1